MIDVLIVVSHPDDEVLYCGGLIAWLSAKGHDVGLVTLTRGELGRTLGVCREEDLAAVREAELRAASRVLGVGKIYLLKFPDGSLNKCFDVITTGLTEIFNRDLPQVVVTFPPNGMNGHLDHASTSRAVKQGLHQAGLQPYSLYYFAAREKFTEPPRDGFLAPDIVADLALPATYSIDVHSVLPTKLAAMGHHETQARSITKYMRLYPRRTLTESFHKVESSFAASLDTLPRLLGEPPTQV